MSSQYRLGESSIRSFRKIRTDGLSLPDRPKVEMPQVPSDITSVGDDDLMELFAEIISWMDYAEVQLAAAQIDEEYEKLQLEEIRAHEQIGSKAKDVTTKKSEAFMNQDFINQRDKCHNAYGYRKIVETGIYNRLERARFIVSREVTRRTGGKVV